MQIKETQDDFHRTTDLEGGDDSGGEIEPASPVEDNERTYHSFPVKEVKREWDKDQAYHYKSFRRNWRYPIVYPMFAGLIALNCIEFASDKEAKANKYTQYQLKINTSFFYTITSSVLLMAMSEFQGLGRFDSKCLRWMFEPFLFLFRLAFFCAYVYFIIYRLFILDFLGYSYFATTRNWWEKKTDPWVTNASYFNALLSWPLWVFAWVVMIWFPLLILFLLFALITRNREIMNVLKDILAETPVIFWRYLRNISSQEYRVGRFDLSKKCVECGKGFTMDDIIGSHDKNCSVGGTPGQHWYHRSCLSDEIKRVNDKIANGQEVAITRAYGTAGFCQYPGCEDKIRDLRYKKDVEKREQEARMKEKYAEKAKWDNKK